MSEIHESAEVERRFSGWSGPSSDLARIVDKVKGLCEEREVRAKEMAEERYPRPEPVPSLPQTDPLPSIEEIILRHDESRDQYQWQRQRDIDEATRSWAVQAEAEYHGKKRKVSGPVDGVLEDLDMRDLKAFTIRTASGEYGSPDYLSVVFGRPEISLKIRSSDVKWLNSAEANILEELKKNLPWWRHLRGRAAGSAYTALWIAAFVCGIAWLADSWAKPGAAYAFASWAVWLGLLTYWSIRRLLPAFDLSSVDRAGIVTRRLGAAAIVILPLLLCVISIVVPLLVA